jgi:hypothetical protein
LILGDAINMLSTSNALAGALADSADSTLQIVKEQQAIHPNRYREQPENLDALDNEQAWDAEVVEDDGIEPTTPCLQSRCSPS